MDIDEIGADCLKRQHESEQLTAAMDCKMQAPENLQNEAVELAIIGMAFRMPGDLCDEASFQAALGEGRDLVTEIPAERWATDELKHSKRGEPGRSITYSAGVLSRIDQFDAGFFGISPREAVWMDPQQRLLLELAWESMENAGVPPSVLAGTNCAVYLGIASLDYGTRALGDLSSVSAHFMTGNALSVAANRLSYVFDLHGPSLAIDTACSSSLVALHHACRALQTGEVETALVGGVSLLLHPYPFVGFTKASMLSAEGRCKPFDDNGKGYVRSEGAAVLLIKPLQKAIADGDDIQAVILATGANADGARKTGITIPSRDGQTELMRSTLAKTQLQPQDVDYVEAHGTGTMVGDPVETAAIGAVYGSGRNEPLPIGSVKANLGHLEAASGMAGLVKTILALKNRTLPAQIHLDLLNSNIDFTGLNLQPVISNQQLKKDGPLVAGINSFGFGGANAHALLREYQPVTSKPASYSPEHFPPLILSARCDAALQALAQLYADRLRGESPEAYYNIAHAAAYRRDRLQKRLQLVVSSVEQAVASLEEFAKGEQPAGLTLEDALPVAGRIAFVYSGNGAQWVGMGQQLLKQSVEFTQLLTQLDVKMQAVSGSSIIEQLHETDQSCLDDTVVAQPLLFALQVALTQYLRSKGIKPAAVTGHSVGEVAAAWASGALDLDSAIRVIVARSCAQGLTRGSGRMAVAGLSADKLRELLQGLGTELDVVVAGINSPNNVTLSGALPDLERVHTLLSGKGVFFRLLDLDYAFHSGHMDPVYGQVIESLEGLHAQDSNDAVFVSTVTGGELSGDQLGAEYWWRNVREPVQFEQAVSSLVDLGCNVFIEVGPHAILQRYVNECLTSLDCKGRLLSTLRKGADSIFELDEIIQRAHLVAATSGPDCFFPESGQPVRLPNYPWQRESYWHPTTSENMHIFTRRRVHPLLGWRLTEAGYSWENILDPVSLPWLADHKVGGAIVFPGAGYAEMALAAASEWLGGECLAAEEMDILSPVVFDGEHARTLRFELNTRDGGFQIKSRQRLSDDKWTVHAVGRILQPAGAASIQITALEQPVNQIDKATHYHLASQLGLEYGPLFQGLSRSSLNDRVLQGELHIPTGLDCSGYHIHPALLDICYQSLVDFYQTDIENDQGIALLPVKTGRLTLHRAGLPSSFRTSIKRRSARSVLADFELYTQSGQLLATVTDCRFRAAPLQRHDQHAISHWVVERRLQPHPAAKLSTRLTNPAELLSLLNQVMVTASSVRKNWHTEGMPLFELLVLAFAYEACQQIQQQHVDALQQLADSRDLYARWLVGLLCGEELLWQEEERWVLAQETNLPSAEQIWLTLEQEHTSALPQLVLLGRVGRALPGLLQKPTEREEFLAGLLRMPAAEILYQEDLAYSGMHGAMEAILCQLAEQLPPRHRLRVLEISAGASELPRSILEKLPEDRLDYVLACPPQVFERQQAEYARQPNLSVAAFDIDSWQLECEQPLPATFDLVVIGHRLHKACNPQAALLQTGRWLAAGGNLVVAERHADWSADFLAGLEASWWHQEGNTDNPLSSLLPAQSWSNALTEAGFADVEVFYEPVSEGQASGAYLLLGSKVLDSESIADNTAVSPLAEWLLLADAASNDCAKKLASGLQTVGHNVRISSELNIQKLPATQHVVCMRGWASTADQAAALLGQLLEDTQQLARHEEQPVRLWLITRGGALVAPDQAKDCSTNPVQAAVWGYGRVVMNELAALNCTLIDLACKDNGDNIEHLLQELLQPDATSEIILSDSGRETLVLAEQKNHQTRPASADERFRLDFHLPGKLTNLVWVAEAEHELADTAVEVEVRATGLNFRDVMYLMGLLPDEAVENGFAGASLGLEFSGVVKRTGAQVQELQPGDRVMGFGSACFSSHVVTRADALAKMPEHWTFESAATVPTVFFTVYYALKQLADIQPGERVLIHGGAGGVGIAAIQLAKHLGAEVFATAGSDDKRDFVHLLGADYVFDSRSLDFANDILAVTGGEGVDVVLNSLAGEAIRRNLHILKPFGRFLELGKRDFFENTPIGLRPFKDNISYFGIDADQLLTGRPQLAGRLFGEVMQLFAEGSLTPLPYRKFPASRVVDAFRVMQQARHIGKIVVSMQNAQPAIERHATATSEFKLESDATWIITGGLSGFGLASARWLVERGVDSLVLVGRRGGATPGAEQALAALQAKGVQVQAVACDIVDPVAVRQMVQQVSQSCPPIKGILHAAAVFDDALVQGLDVQRMQAVLEPKLQGAWNLHQASLSLPLEYFVLYSSITTVIGNPGQANYVAANAGLEGLVAMRRQQNLPASFVGWGPIADAGYLTRNETVRDSLGQRLGKPPLEAAAALNELTSILSGQHSRVIGNFEWSTLSRLLPSNTSERFMLLNRNLKKTGLVEDEGSIQELIAGKTTEETLEIISKMVAGEVAQILAVNAERIDHGRVLHDLGLDSLMAVELAMGLEQRFGIQLPVMMLNESPTVTKVSQYIAGKLLGDQETENSQDNALDSLITGLAHQHGEVISADTVQQFVSDIRAEVQMEGKPES